MKVCTFITRGSAAANSMSQVTICLLLFAYIRWKNLHVKTWGGKWTTNVLCERLNRFTTRTAFKMCFKTKSRQ